MIKSISQDELKVNASKYERGRESKYPQKEVGVISYDCKNKRHCLCSKLKCSCNCHDK
jgi:hypothetical protein